MRLTFLPLFMLVVTAISTKAQYSAEIKPSSDSLIKANITKRGKYTSVLYTINGAPFTKSTIETRLMAYNPSAIELQQYHTIRRQSLTGGVVCGGAAILAAIGGAIQANQQGGSGSAYSKAPVFFSVSIAGLIGEAICLSRRNEHFGKAIELYNARF